MATLLVRSSGFTLALLVACGSADDGGSSRRTAGGGQAGAGEPLGGGGGSAGTTEAGASGRAELCTRTQGIISSAECCQTAADFPGSCALGGCGCGPGSRLVRICECPAGTCFDVTAGCVTE